MGYSFHSMRYYLSDHPSVVGFRWSHAQSWGSTWSFLFASISLYAVAATVLHSTLLLLRGRRPVPLGPLPALHSLAMTLASATIFAGLLLSAAAEIRDIRWLLRRSRTTPLQWLLCFPVGTRPSGRVFFWSYAHYLSRFLHALGAFVTVLRQRRLPASRLLQHSVVIATSFLWLEFSQSFQILAILLTSVACVAVCGYRFWTAAARGLPPFMVKWQMAVVGCNVVCHGGVLALHCVKGGGCNGIGAWIFTSIVNGVVVMSLYARKRRRLRLEKDLISVDETN